MTETKILKQYLDKMFKDKYVIIPNTSSLSGLCIIETPLGERKITIENDKVSGWVMGFNTQTDGLSNFLDKVKYIHEESREYLYNQWLEGTNKKK